MPKSDTASAQKSAPQVPPTDVFPTVPTGSVEGRKNNWKRRARAQQGVPPKPSLVPVKRGISSTIVCGSEGNSGKKSRSNVSKVGSSSLVLAAAVDQPRQSL